MCVLRGREIRRKSPLHTHTDAHFILGEAPSSYHCWEIIMLWKGAFPLLPLLFWLRFLRLSEPRANTHLNHSTFLPPASLCPPSFHQPLSSSPPPPLCGFVNKDKQTSGNEEWILSIRVPVPVFCSVSCFFFFYPSIRPVPPIVTRRWWGERAKTKNSAFVAEVQSCGRSPHLDGNSPFP